jgi:hypothetical protein
MKIVISEQQLRRIITEQSSQQPICNESGCSGTYTGVEFNGSGDIAHQYSNIITKSVGLKLKELYKSGTYVKVNFTGIKMSTKGMGSGNVIYTVNIPFIGVSDKCDAMTGFAHVGGWGHTPALSTRKQELLGYIPDGKTENVILGNKLDISQLTTTKEGLQEYWIQWKHRDYQSECSGKIVPVNKPTPVNTVKSISIQSTDLTTFLNDIKTQTLNTTLDLSSAVINVDKLSLTVKSSDKGVLVKKLILALSTQADGDTAANNILSKNPGSKVVTNGTFEGGKRTYNLIAII